MKKKYMEPQMIVEDFSVSEMIAADCAIPEGELKVVTHLSMAHGCDTGDEPEYWVGGKPNNGKPNGKGTAYGFLSDLFDGSEHGKDINGDGIPNHNDNAFLSQYAVPGVCDYDPIKAGQTFGYGYTCNDDVSALQKS